MTSTVPPPAIMCDVCHTVIKGKIVSALGRTWHPEHFVCTECGVPITGDKFNHKDNKPWCETCYAHKHLKTCKGCSKPITNKVIMAMDAYWHEEHFTCATCLISLSGTPFYERDGKAYCLNDFQNNFASRCNKCNQPIIDSAVVALDGKWHQACFTCAKCGTPVTDPQFHVQDNQPVCKKCTSEV